MGSSRRLVSDNDSVAVINWRPKLRENLGFQIAECLSVSRFRYYPLARSSRIFLSFFSFRTTIPRMVIISDPPQTDRFLIRPGRSMKGVGCCLPGVISLTITMPLPICIYLWVRRGNRNRALCSNRQSWTPDSPLARGLTVRVPSLIPRRRRLEPGERRTRKASAAERPRRKHSKRWLQPTPSIITATSYADSSSVAASSCSPCFPFPKISSRIRRCCRSSAFS